MLILALMNRTMLQLLSRVVRVSAVYQAPVVNTNTSQDSDTLRAVKTAPTVSNGPVIGLKLSSKSTILSVYVGAFRYSLSELLTGSRTGMYDPLSCRRC